MPPIGCGITSGIEIAVGRRLSGHGPRIGSRGLGDRLDQGGGAFPDLSWRLCPWHGDPKAKAGELHLERTVWALRRAVEPEYHRGAGREGHRFGRDGALGMIDASCIAQEPGIQHEVRRSRDDLNTCPACGCAEVFTAVAPPDEREMPLYPVCCRCRCERDDLADFYANRRYSHAALPFLPILNSSSKKAPGAGISS